MTPENFCYWLQGRAELASEAPTPEQWTLIKQELQRAILGDGIKEKPRQAQSRHTNIPPDNAYYEDPNNPGSFFKKPMT